MTLLVASALSSHVICSLDNLKPLSWHLFSTFDAELLLRVVEPNGGQCSPHPKSMNIFTLYLMNECGFSEQALRYTSNIWAINWCIKIVLSYFFALSNNFSFLYLSLYTTFESKTWQFTEIFEIEFGENNLGFLWQYIYTF
jgi:hypothetical protein